MTARDHSISSSAGACVRACLRACLLASLCVRTALPSHNTRTPRHCNLLPSWADRQMLEAAKYIQYLRFDVAFVVAHYLALTMSSPFACTFEVIEADKLRCWCCIMGRYILSRVAPCHCSRAVVGASIRFKRRLVVELDSHRGVWQLPSRRALSLSLSLSLLVFTRSSEADKGH